MALTYIELGSDGQGGGGSGDVVGPASSATNDLAAFADITGKLLKVAPTVTVAQGGTNSSTALNNNRVIQSSSGQIKEAAAITAARALISDANGIPTQSAVTSTELGYVGGVTSAIQTQINTINTGGGGSTPIITTDTLSADFATGSATYVDTGLDCTFTLANNNDPFIVQFGGTWIALAVAGNAVLAFAFDGGTEDMMVSIAGGTGRQNPTIQKIYTNLAAGAHTVKLRMRNDGAAGTHTLVHDGLENETPTLQVIQFR